MVLSVLPVNSTPNQTFEASLPIDQQNRKFKFIFTWNPVGRYWQLDLFDQNNGGLQLLNKMPIFAINYPYNNIIVRYKYKEIGSIFLVNINENSSPLEDRPNIDNLGTDWVVVWGDTPYA